MMPRPFAAPSLLRTLGLTIIGIGVMFAVDALLAKVEQDETRVEAKNYFENATRLMQQGRASDAAEQLRSAIAVDRNNRDYRVALGQALVNAGQYPEAVSTLEDLLLDDPFSGPANLAMARVRANQGETTTAIRLFHRAIYGRWPDDPQPHQVQVRFELADLLDRQHMKQDLLAELLPLEGQLGDDAAQRKRLGTLFLDAGSPARAEEVFRGVARDYPRDADAFTSLGQAQFAAGDYRHAQAAFRRSLILRPDDQQTRQKLIECDEVLDLNPTGRELSPDEQYNRGRKLLEAVLDDVLQCLGSSSAPPLIQTVEQGLRRFSSLEQNLKWADDLWEIRTSQCTQPISESEQPLALVLGMLAH